MRRGEYEQQISRTVRSVNESLAARYMMETSRLDALLSDLQVKINVYQDGGLWLYRILDWPSEQPLIEGLNPAYANAGDYRRIVLRVRDGL